MKKEQKILIEKLSTVEERAVLIATGKTGFVDVAIVWNESTQFIVRLSYTTRYGFKEEQPLYYLHNVYTISGYMSSYFMEKLENAIKEVNSEIESLRKDAE